MYDSMNCTTKVKLQEKMVALPEQLVFLKTGNMQHSFKTKLSSKGLLYLRLDGLYSCISQCFCFKELDYIGLFRAEIFRKWLALH